MESGRVIAVLPAVAYAERIRQLRADSLDIERWREGIATAGIAIEPFGEREAERVPAEAGDPALWRKHARDYLVAAHVEGDREVVTSDRGPAWKGIRVLTPARAAEAIRDLLRAVSV